MQGSTQRRVLSLPLANNASLIINARCTQTKRCPSAGVTSPRHTCIHHEAKDVTWNPELLAKTAERTPPVVFKPTMAKSILLVVAAAKDTRTTNGAGRSTINPSGVFEIMRYCRIR